LRIADRFGLDAGVMYILDDVNKSLRLLKTFGCEIDSDSLKDFHHNVEANKDVLNHYATGITTTPTSTDLARSLFNKMREAYWPERLRLAVPGEFNPYNLARMRLGKPLMGPDGFPIELDHREQLSKSPQRAPDPTDIWEPFHRQHDFQHGEHAFRLHTGSFPRKPTPKSLRESRSSPVWPP
jgi:hypothetical protein